MAILVIEQNIGVATAVSDRVAIMVNGRINRIMDAKELASDRELQQSLLGVGRHADVETTPQPAEMAQAQEQLADVYRIERSGGETADSSGVRAYRPVTDLPNRWNVPAATLRQTAVEKTTPADETKKIFAIPFAERIGRTALVVGTFDTKGKELRFMADRLKKLGIPVRTVDLSTSGKPSSADVPANQVASMHPRGTSEVMSGDRGKSVEAMAEAFARWIERERGHRRHHLGRRLGRHHACHGRHARAAGRHSEDHGLDGRCRRCRQVCRRRRHHDVPFGGRRAGPELDHRGRCSATPRTRWPA